MKNLNINIEKVRQSGSVALNDKVARLKSEGRKIISLNSGDPNFNTPAVIVESAKDAMMKGFTHYSDSRGIAELRKALADKIKNWNSGEYNFENEILVTCGAIHAFYLSLKTILNNGDEVLVPDPTWMTHANMVNLLGAKAIRVPALEKNNFYSSIDSLNEYCTEKTKAVVINSPSNPTGAVADKDYLEAFAKFAVERNLFIISDEVYESITFDNTKSVSLASIPSIKNNLLLINSFSKTYAMTGWRIGYLAAPKKIIDEAIKASQYSITSLPPFIQHAAVTALTDTSIQHAIEKMRLEYEKRRNKVNSIFKEFNSDKLRARIPKGAFYYFIDIKNVSTNSVEFCEKLLENKGIALVPGSIYGMHGEGYIRFSLASSMEDIIDGAEGLIDFVQKY
ncbi:MAG: pyridoxal phosphate-dependent aminotransferase [Ignavibacteriae bacterium]|nr:pyridoxal phosphate-dependent aminotransferase [Ignavibacteriota bacterium]NOG98209.1 pyridoxal phosphate-dependent aminotransferase [Ignavibacteriota bacterium]